ncbi:MAG TPA: hypothetical protein VFI91_00310, partial [Longimicrobiaceae bacterium]|nr:hypothetical protein [Longimicrobiaceae bacterium]
VRLSWQPWQWGILQREREILSVQKEILDTEASAFADRLRRAAQADWEMIQHLIDALDSDAHIARLRRIAEAAASAQLAERVITPAEYIDIRTDLHQARLALRRHRVELARARAQYLTAWGIR